MPLTTLGWPPPSFFKSGASLGAPPSNKLAFSMYTGSITASRSFWVTGSALMAPSFSRSFSYKLKSCLRTLMMSESWSGMKPWLGSMSSSLSLRRASDSFFLSVLRVLIMGASPLTSTIPSSSSSESELALRLARKSKKKIRQMNYVLLISGEYRINSSITSKYKNWLFFWNLKMQIGYFDGEYCRHSSAYTVL